MMIGRRGIRVDSDTGTHDLIGEEKVLYFSPLSIFLMSSFPNDSTLGVRDKYGIIPFRPTLFLFNEESCLD